MQISANRHKTVWAGTERLWPSLNGVLAYKVGCGRPAGLVRCISSPMALKSFKEKKKRLILDLTHIRLILRVAVLRNN